MLLGIQYTRVITIFTQMINMITPNWCRFTLSQAHFLVNKYHLLSSTMLSLDMEAVTLQHFTCLCASCSWATSCCSLWSSALSSFSLWQAPSAWCRAPSSSASRRCSFRSDSASRLRELCSVGPRPSDRGRHTAGLYRSTWRNEWRTKLEIVVLYSPQLNNYVLFICFTQRWQFILSILVMLIITLLNLYHIAQIDNKILKTLVQSIKLIRVRFNLVWLSLSSEPTGTRAASALSLKLNALIVLMLFPERKCSDANIVFITSWCVRIWLKPV